MLHHLAGNDEAVLTPHVGEKFDVGSALARAIVVLSAAWCAPATSKSCMVQYAQCCRQRLACNIIMALVAALWWLPLLDAGRVMLVTSSYRNPVQHTAVL